MTKNKHWTKPFILCNVENFQSTYETINSYNMGRIICKTIPLEKSTEFGISLKWKVICCNQKKKELFLFSRQSNCWRIDFSFSVFIVGKQRIRGNLLSNNNNYFYLEISVNPVAKLLVVSVVCWTQNHKTLGNSC